jgi:hypothetical protein
MEIKIGTPVLAEDGQAGTVERIILHPETSEIEGVVAVQGRLLTRDVVIPADRLLMADHDGLRVRGTAEEIDALEPFAQSQYVDPPEDWLPPSGHPAAFYLLPASPLLVGAFPPPTMQTDLMPEEVENLEEGDVEVSGTTTVFCTDGACGRLDRVVTEDGTDHVLFLIVQRGRRSVQVPVEQVARMDRTGIHLRLTQGELDRLPEFEESE